MIVVCGIDGSPNAQHALQWSADLVAGTGGEVIAVHAVGLVEELQGETVPSASHRREIEDLCVTVWCAQLARSGVEWRHAVLDGHPVDVMLRVGRGVRRRPDRRRPPWSRQRGGDREHEHRTGSPRHVPGRDRPVVRTVTGRPFSRARSSACGASATPTATTPPRCGTARRPGPHRGASRSPG